MSRPITAVRLPIELEQSLLFCANELHKTKSELVQEALTNYLADMQDYISAKKILARNEETYTLAEVEKKLGL